MKCRISFPGSFSKGLKFFISGGMINGQFNLGTQGKSSNVKLNESEEESVGLVNPRGSVVYWDELVERNFKK